MLSASIFKVSKNKISSHLFYLYLQHHNRDRDSIVHFRELIYRPQYIVHIHTTSGTRDPIQTSALGTCCKRHGYPVRKKASLFRSSLSQPAGKLEFTTHWYLCCNFSSRNGSLGLRGKSYCMSSNNVFKVDCSRVCGYTIVL